MQEKKRRKIASDEGVLDFSKMNLAWYYVRYESCVSMLLDISFGLLRIKQPDVEYVEQLVFDKGSETLDEDFNFTNLIERQRLSNFETE